MKEDNFKNNEKLLKVNCSFCNKEMECPEDMMNAKYHACFECFQEREEELSKLDEGKLHVDMPMDEAFFEGMVSTLVEENFPEVWTRAKKDVKEMSKKEVAGNMFVAGILVALKTVLGPDKEFAQDKREAM